MATIFPAVAPPPSASESSSVILPATASATTAFNDMMLCDHDDNATMASRIMAADESGALDALAALASASTAVSVSSISHESNAASHHSHQPQEITPHQTSSDDDDSEIMPPPPPRSPTTMSTLGSVTAASTTTTTTTTSYASVPSGIPSFAFLHDSTPLSNMNHPTLASGYSGGGCGRLRSVSNPEGMEKWDSYSRQNDRLHFVLPSSILEEELASTRRVLGEVAEDDHDDLVGNGNNDTGFGMNNGEGNNGRQFANHGFTLQPLGETSNAATGFQQHWVRRSQRCIARLGTSPDSVSSNLADEDSPPKVKASRVKMPKSPKNNNAGNNNNTSSSSSSKSKKKASSRSKSPPQIVSSRSPPPEEDEEEVDESTLEPEELLRRARSRLLEDLSEGTSGGAGGSGANGEKGGSVLILPHSLNKYKEVYNKNGRIGIYTPAERAAIIQKFNAKRARRVWNKKIRYNCRKNLADRRMRVKGRFVKRSVEAAGTPPPQAAAEPELANNVKAKAATLRSSSPPTSGSPLTTVTEDQEMPDVEDEEAGFQPTEDMPYRRTRRYTIT